MKKGSMAFICFLSFRDERKSILSSTGLQGKAVFLSIYSSLLIATRVL